MRQHGIRILVAAVLALAFVLGWMWVDSKGQPRPRASDLLKKRSVAAK